jgi:hypothetical protein
MNGRKHFTVAGYVKTGMAAASLVIIAVAASAVGAQAAGPTWTVAKSANVTLSGGTIESVSCSTPTACTGVGTNLNTSGIYVTLAERWDGASWQRQATPNPPGNTTSSVAPNLLGVSCPAATFCAAVGEYQSGFIQASMAETWNGQQWTMQPFPVPADSSGAELTGVSCTSPTFCEAVGGYFDGDVGDNVTLAAVWNGTSWSLQSTPAAPEFNFEQFNAVSCASTAFCVAWASGNGANPGVTMAEQWDGSSWQLQTAPSDSASVNSVSCASKSFCKAVGLGTAYAWDGSAWTAQTLPAPASTGNLGGVSCTSKKFCEATGEYNTGGKDVTVAAEWNGSAWAVQTTPNPATSTFAQMNAVSCASASSCEAAGYFDVQGNANDPKAMAEGWDGNTWQLQHPVAPPGATFNALRAISCVSVSFCEAVGTHFDSAGADTEVNLAETWNGQSWVIQKTPDQPGAVDDELLGVSCVSAQFCEAVGVGTYAEMWNGTSWTIQNRPGAQDVDGQHVSCVSTSFCLSVDAFANVDTWDGTSWSAGPAVAGFSGVASVSCLSATFCEVVGAGPSGENAAVWNGTSWTDQATPGPASAALDSVSCTTPSSCEAVGQNFDQNSDQVITLAESWDGSAWTIQSTPNPSATQGSQLSGVSCTSATSCTAAGSYQSSNTSTFGAFQTLVETWDGTAWTIQSSPNPGAGDQLEGVSCGASQVCTAVGQAPDPGGVEATLIETGN